MTATKTRMTRSSKTTKVLPKVEELRPVKFSEDGSFIVDDSDIRPEPLLKFSDYVSDVKLRWKIHQFEMKKLGEDLTQLRKFISEKTSQFSDLMYYTWCEM